MTQTYTYIQQAEGIPRKMTREEIFRDPRGTLGPRFESVRTVPMTHSKLPGRHTPFVTENLKEGCFVGETGMFSNFAYGEAGSPKFFFRLMQSDLCQVVSGREGEVFAELSGKMLPADME